MSILSRIKTDFPDLYLNLFPFGMFMLSIAYACEFFNIYTNDRREYLLEYIQGFSVAAILLVGAPATMYNGILEHRKIKKNPNQISLTEAGFVQTRYNTVAVHSFSFVFIELLFVGQLGPRILPDQPMKFFFDAVISATLQFFSITYWVEVIKSNVDDKDGFEATDE